MFVLDVVVNFTRLSDDQLYHQLKRIKRQSEEEENTFNSFANIGFLTSLPRNKWAEARAHLIEGVFFSFYLIFKMPKIQKPLKFAV
jgi:hypothetical protein